MSLSSIITSIIQLVLLAFFIKYFFRNNYKRKTIAFLIPSFALLFLVIFSGGLDLGAIPVLFIGLILVVGVSFILNIILKKWMPDQGLTSPSIQNQPIIEESRGGRRRKILLGVLLAIAHPFLLGFIYIVLLIPIGHISNVFLGPNPALTPSNKFFMSTIAIFLGIVPFAAIAFVLLGFWFFPYLLLRPVSAGKKAMYVIAYILAPYALMAVFGVLSSLIYLE
ncbi:MAG: hypothetical protein A3J09_00985 [Candidatus Zambryskibacteria bacterium RIFCSPLOWO2_02_FULL_51_21]|uniref:Uncharacterized protein n=1 Tax=Candidatus Zambryskibacteria bacterium RIFCSPHIGHO2_02_FULL_43_37 TaxID=1802749 RepID=A0A1G2THU5_9BACT|nr:MAG: hypothetical protein A2723_00985 [Candidatus Zambryskibacteria bacterium RIFCSPHIGHO2_01_FULL_52_18]OHA96772.1 MAG: hypothetical protein A3D49_02945 [Candidatus Zambryskibacteria bacterium RIFCSPHIGHO2_02_FULL_43_37]OHB07466.1 MAG: hypothetical protein A2944_02015 [Candidatus Zambryskibacteria bacterium RIFCSPLOWO2_01_FULL_52_12]OHB11129.1 MAG: hypothetical protein A3J09_00985 [Candidatus Zambryskibacteria bacterium RIFCSPLOWO2_02_FULL_51_21]